MRRILRLLWYVRPFWFQLFASIAFMALVGGLTAFRAALFRPIFARVLKPESQSADIVLFQYHSHTVYLQQLVPGFMHNAWTMVAFVMVVSTVFKGIFDYIGTYLVNYAGYGLITDLRDDVFSTVLRRSSSFFHRNPTGTVVSTIINDIDKVQTAMSNVLAEFLQQLFTLIFVAALAIYTGGKLSWVLLVFFPFIISSARRIGRRVRSTTRKGQDKLAEIQNILHETITGNRIVKAFGMELWELARFQRAASRLFHAGLRSVSVQAIGSPLMDAIGDVEIVMLLFFG